MRPHRLASTAIATVLSLTSSLPAAVALGQTAEAEEPRMAALALSKQGLDAYLAGRYQEAEQRYADAWRLWPGEPLYLYNAARAAERAGRLEAAERMYSLYLDKAPAGQAEIAKARFHLAEIKANRKHAGAPTGPGHASSAGSGRGTAGLAILITGGVIAAGGGLLLGSAASDQTDLDTRLSQRNAQGAIVGISHTDALAKQNAINTSKYVGWGMVGGGALAGVTGAILMATAPSSRVAIAPALDGRGVQLAWRF